MLSASTSIVREVHLHQWFALYSNIIGIFRSDGVTDLVDDSVPDMVVSADILALKEMHGICS